LRLLNRLVLLGSEHRAVVGRSRVGRRLDLRGRRVGRVDHRRVRIAVTCTCTCTCTALSARSLDDGTVAAADGRRCATGTRATACDDGTLTGRNGGSVVTRGDTAAGAGTRATTGTNGSDTASATCADAAPECGAFLTEDVAVPTGVGPTVCPGPSACTAGSGGRGDRSGGYGAAAGSGGRNTAGTGLRPGIGTGTCCP